MLTFVRLHRGYYIANPDGSTEERLGEPIYVIRTTPALERDCPDTPYRAETPDGLIMVSGCTYDEAYKACDDHAKEGWEED